MSNSGNLSMWSGLWNVAQVVVAAMGAFVTAGVAVTSLRSAVDEWRERRQFDDMRALCRGRLASRVRSFEPNVLFAWDGRGGVWAEIIADALKPRPRVVVGLRLKHEGPKAATKLFAGYNVLRARDWNLYIPKTLFDDFGAKRVLFVDDYVMTGSTIRAFIDYAVREKHIPGENVSTLAVLALRKASPAPMIVGSSLRREPELPYMVLR